MGVDVVGGNSWRSDCGLRRRVGSTLKVDFTTTVKEWQPLANAGDARAQTVMGRAYEFGQGTEQDYGKAFELISKSAAQNYAGGQMNLGILYATGRGVAKNEAKAAEWYRKAAEQGNIAALNNLGALYSYADTLAPDYTLAYMCYLLAAKLGDRGAAPKNIELLNHLANPAQVREAKELAYNWKLGTTLPTKTETSWQTEVRGNRTAGFGAEYRMRQGWYGMTASKDKFAKLRADIAVCGIQPVEDSITSAKNRAKGIMLPCALACSSAAM